MNAWLSILLSLAMCLSGVLPNDGEQALAARSWRMDNLTVLLGGEAYMLEPTVRVGLSDESGATALKALIRLGDGVLPLEWSTEPEGTAFRLADTAYRTDPRDIPPSDDVALLGEMAALTAEVIRENRSPLALSELRALRDEIPPAGIGASAKPYALGDETRTGYPVTATPDADALWQFLEEEAGLRITRILTRAISLLDAINREETDGFTVASAELTGHVDAAQKSAYALDIDWTLDRDGTALTLPMSVALNAADELRLSAALDAFESGGTMTYTEDALQTGRTQNLSVTGWDGSTLELLLAEDRAEVLSGVASLRFARADREYIVNATYDDEGLFVVISAQVLTERDTFTYELSFNLTEEEAPMAVFMPAADEMRVTEENLSEVKASMLKALSPLTQNPGMAALNEALKRSRDAMPEEEETLAPAGGRSEGLSFPLPVFTYLPEGYALSAPGIFVQGSDETLIYDIEAETGEDKPSLAVNFEKSGAKTVTCYALDDASEAPTGPVVILSESAVRTSASVSYADGLELIIVCHDRYDPQELLSIVRGISWDTPAEP